VLVVCACVACVYVCACVYVFVCVLMFVLMSVVVADVMSTPLFEQLCVLVGCMRVCGVYTCVC